MKQIGAHRLAAFHFVPQLSFRSYRRPALLVLVLTAFCASLSVPSGLSAVQGDGALRSRHLRIRGNEYIGDAELRFAIATSRADWSRRTPIVSLFGAGHADQFDEFEFRRDVLRIKALYAARGFPNAVIDTIITRSDEHVDISIRIEEGRPVRVVDIRVLGVPAHASTSDFMAAIPLQVGAPFDRVALDNAEVAMIIVARDLGYPFANVTTVWNETSPNDSSPTGIVVRFDLDTGPRAVIGEIDVVGAQRVDQRVILQHLAVEPGDQYSERSLYDSQLALFRTSLFTFVDVSLTDSVPASPNDTLVTVNVRTHVIENALKTARIGAGYGTLDCFRIRSGLELLNFAGDGRRLDLTGRLSQVGTGRPLGAGFEHSVCPALAKEDEGRLKLNYHVGATLREPLLFAKGFSATVGVFAERHTEIRAFLRRTERVEASLTRELSHDIPLTLTYALSRGRTDADPVTFCIFLDICRVEDTRLYTQARRQSVLSLSFSRHSTNSVFVPTSGTGLTSDVSWASSLIGSDTLVQFLRTEAEFTSYHAVGDVTLAWRLAVGAVFVPRVSLVSGAARFTPPEERFYTGGPNSVRGFSQNELGPVIRVVQSIDSSTTRRDSVIRSSATGGDQFGLASVELRIPLHTVMDGLTGSLFLDAGLLTNRDVFTFDDLRMTPGFGARLDTPIGPVGFDIGINPYAASTGPLYVADGTELKLIQPDYRPSKTLLDRFRLHFSVGQAF